jgi:hypothetical protein
MSGLSTVFKLGFEISPVILTNGIAENIPGKMLPIVSITEAANFVTGLLDGGSVLSLDNFFAHWVPIPGSTLANNQIGQYPFANQTVAANAIIAQPLQISMRMICPVKTSGGYAAKLVTISALQAALASHNNSGGTYTIATPSFLYTNCVMLGMKDISNGQSKQVQTEWQFDFLQPLVALADAQSALNGLMSKISGGTPISGDPTWSSIGTPAATPSLVPAATPLSGISVGGSP